MRVKVCGIRDEANARDVASLGVDMMGFIFYPKSPRYVEGLAPLTPPEVARVGVFVGASLDDILLVVERNTLQYVQLHSNESPRMCRKLRSRGVRVIKAISVGSEADIALADRYQGAVDYLLFDTKCSGYGGSGESFDWSILSTYKGNTPFLLSGGIDSESVELIRSLEHPMLVGVDLNSRFEVAPAVKDVEKLRCFIENLKR